MSHPWREKLEACTDEEQAAVIAQVPVMLELLEHVWRGLRPGRYQNIKDFLLRLPLGWEARQHEASPAPAPRPSFPPTGGRGRFFPRSKP